MNMPGGMGAVLCVMLTLALAIPPAHAQSRSSCDKACLEGIADQYRDAYSKRNATLAPIDRNVRFTENGVEMRFPDGSWDTITREVGPPLTLSDPKSGQA